MTFVFRLLALCPLIFSAAAWAAPSPRPALDAAGPLLLKTHGSHCEWIYAVDDRVGYRHNHRHLEACPGYTKDYDRHDRRTSGHKPAVPAVAAKEEKTEVLREGSGKRPSSEETAEGYARTDGEPPPCGDGGKPQRHKPSRPGAGGCDDRSAPPERGDRDRRHADRDELEKPYCGMSCVWRRAQYGHCNSGCSYYRRRYENAGYGWSRGSEDDRSGHGDHRRYAPLK